MTGHIANPPDISQGATHLKYKVELSNDGGSTWTQHLSNTFTLGRDQLLNAIWSDLPSATQSVDGDGWYEYQEDLIGDGTNPKIFPVGNLLARWQTGGLTGLWKIRIKAKNPDIVGPVWISDDVTVMLDNTAPTVSITITSGGGACADFLIGDVISGTYAVSDEHFGSLRFSVLPALGGSFTNPAPLPAGPTMPLRRTFAGGVPTIGEAGNWSLDTTGMPRCGYVIELWAWDRTIRNSGFIGFGDRVVVGLCLRETTE